MPPRGKVSPAPRQPPRRRGRPPVYSFADEGRRIVKKYGNRRLYDTRESRYITLDELMELFVSDRELRVVDAATGEDLTERTLRQAVLSDDSAGSALMSEELLRALVKYRRGTARTDFERHIAKAIVAFHAKRNK
jgi:polyhydroxyalkanoate synthesis repressor PhaR